MKITVEVDCTPIEARQFLGLPNAEPLQASMMAKLEERISEEIDRFSPDTLMKSWFAVFPQNVEWAKKMFDNVFGGGTISLFLPLVRKPQRSLDHLSEVVPVPVVQFCRHLQSP
jgi:hypothetical protein